AQRTVVLAVPLRRDHALPELLRQVRRGERQLVRLPAALRQPVLPGTWPGPLDPLAAPAFDLVARRCDQLPRDDPQHAGARDELDAYPAVRLVDRDLRGPARDRPAGLGGRPDTAPARPPGGNALLHPSARRQRDPVSALLLVLRTPRGLHHDPARDGDHLGSSARVLPQADLRLQGDRVLDRGHRLLLDARL